MDEEQYNVQGDNRAYMEPNVLQLRLDTNELLDKIEVFLSGYRITYMKDATGKVVSEKVKVGIPNANELGTQMIVNWVSMQLNAAVVQGNIKEENQYFYFLERTRKTLARMLLVNSPKWGICREDRLVITSSIMNMIELFVSRTLDNSERESYTQSLAARVGLARPPEQKSAWKISN